MPPLQWASAMEAAAPGAAADLYPYLQQGQQPQEAVLPCYVLQQAGDVLFVPNMWSHQVLTHYENCSLAVAARSREVFVVLCACFLGIGAWCVLLLQITNLDETVGFATELHAAE